MKVRILVLALALLGVSAPVAAQDETSFQLEQFEAVDPSTSVLNVARASVVGHLEYGAGIVSHYASEPLVLVRNESTDSRLVASSLTAEALATFGLFDVGHIGLAMPFGVLQTGDDLAVAGRPGETARGTAAGDLRLLQRAIIPLDGPIGVGLQSRLYIPTGDVKTFRSDGAVRWEPRLLVDAEVGPVVIAANAGYQFRPRTTLQNAVVDDAVRWGIGVDWNVHDVHFVRAVGFGSVQLEADRDPADPARSASRNSTSPIEALLAYAIEIDSAGLFVSAGGGTALNDHVGAAAWRAVLSFGFRPPDSADEGRAEDEPKNTDEAEKDPEKPDETEAVEAVAENRDRDHDGVPDENDACPDHPGPNAETGCPETSLLLMEGDRITAKVPVVDEESGGITSDGRRAIEQLAGLLEGAGPSIASVTVEAHVFESTDEVENLARSQKIADSVREAIVDAGVDAARVEARGLGDARRLEGVDLGARVDFVIERRKYQRLQD